MKPGYSCAITDAVVQLSIEWSEGKDGSLKFWKNRPCPSVTVGRSRPKANLSPSATITLLIKASPLRRPVSRKRESPWALPKTYIMAGTATNVIVPPLEILSLRLIAERLDRSRSILRWSLANNTPAVPITGNAQVESFGDNRNGKVQMVFWSPGKLMKTFFSDIGVVAWLLSLSNTLFCTELLLLFPCGSGSATASDFADFREVEFWIGFWANE